MENLLFSLVSVHEKLKLRGYIHLHNNMKGQNTMKTIISSTLIFIGIAMMAGSAGDCDGKCMQNANSLLEMFMYALGLSLIHI